MCQKEERTSRSGVVVAIASTNQKQKENSKRFEACDTKSFFRIQKLSVLLSVWGWIEFPVSDTHGSHRVELTSYKRPSFVKNPHRHTVMESNTT